MNEEQKPLPADIQPPDIQPPDIQPPSPAPHQREQLAREAEAKCRAYLAM